MTEINVVNKKNLRMAHLDSVFRKWNEWPESALLPDSVATYGGR
jgi:hypothetical protein